MVHLTGITTKTGDGGRTRLADGSSVPKTDPRVDAYGTVDEANSVLGVLLSSGELPVDIADLLAQVQNDLFDVGADLATPLSAERAHPPLRIKPKQVAALEQAIAAYNADLPELPSFVLPGGNQPAALAQLARAVVRRAERAAWALEDANTEAIKYLNRLSDLLFVLGRVLAQPHEVLWRPSQAEGSH
ncbi:MAG: cob(I)yrinic acid a,c-diamide adenosyltransferase [Propionibacteriaceae bacterium]|nr:cob(I)yrinic acid a,c-diamide adenosyltransferase [Propionibacteriaceae bacterium]